jgi:putative FmdB family regulatory protein
MPLYEYKCGSCGDVFEVIQKFSDEPLTVHEKCGGPLERLVSAAALQFKGTGWYVTDYARKNGAPKSDSERKSGTESKSGSEGKKTEGTKTDSSTPSTPSSGSTSKPSSSDK